MLYGDRLYAPIQSWASQPAANRATNDGLPVARARRTAVAARREHADGDGAGDPRGVRRPARPARPDPQPRQPARVRRRVRPGQPDPRRRAPRPGSRRDRARRSTGCRSSGCIERRPDPDDRRVWMVAITAGRQGARPTEVADVDAVLRAELRSGISRAERQDLAAVLVRLQNNVAVAVHGTTTDPSIQHRRSNHDERSHRRRGPHAGRQAQRQAEGLAPGRSRGLRPQGAARSATTSTRRSSTT